MATTLGVTNMRYWYNYPKLAVDLSHKRFVLDHNRCILCTRCVRVCTELEGAHVWEVNSRGIHSRIISDTEPAVGTVDQLHQLRQVRAGVSYRRACRKRLGGGRNGQAERQH